MNPLLKVAKIAITHLTLGPSPQNQQNFQGRENSSEQLINKICSCSSFVEICVTYKCMHPTTHSPMHAHT